MKSNVLTVTLNPAIDKTVVIPNFRRGKDFREKALFVAAGGKGINVSRVLHHLGISTIATGFMGGYSGDYLKGCLDEEGIKHDFISINENARESLTIIDPVLNNITRVLERGPLVTKGDLASFRKRFTQLLTRSSYVVFSGRSIPGANDNFYGELIETAKKINVPTVFDTSGKPYILGLKKKPFMIKPNVKEAEQAVGKKLSSLSKIKKAAKELHGYGIKIVAITMGSKGAVVFDGNQMVFAVPPRLKRISPVGCGDAFIAGFIASLINKKSFSHCVKMAVACGAANVLHVNPGFIRSSDLKKVLKQTEVKILNSR